MTFQVSDKDEVNFRSLALRRVSIREYSASELKSYLLRKGAPEAEASLITEELVNDGIVDDQRYARVIARHQAFRDKGPSYVWMRLREKGVGLSLREVQTLYEECLPGTSESEIELARKVVERRYPKALDDRAVAKKAYVALLRRGFSKDVIRRILFSRPGEKSV